MGRDNSEADAVFSRETPEQAAHAIANALEFLRNEAAAMGLRDVGILIGIACARTRSYSPPAGTAGSVIDSITIVRFQR
jgi:hypothetical protein